MRNPYLCTSSFQHINMSDLKKVGSALLSVYHKEGLEPLVHFLHRSNVTLYATGGTRDFIVSLGIPVTAVEDITDYPSILGGRVKTLHPKVFGGILGRRDQNDDLLQLEKYSIPPIDLVIVDLYPFSETVAQGGTESEIIEKIDIGGVSLIRAAAKNFKDVVIVPSRDDYHSLLTELENHGNHTTLIYRKSLATKAFDVTSDYDRAIGKWFSGPQLTTFHENIRESRTLRYGENPHQKGIFFGPLQEVFEQLSGKELSYNNLLDIDAALQLVNDFSTPVTAILKHNNACGVACGPDPMRNWQRALQADPVSAFGGIIVTTSAITVPLAEEMGKLFFEVLMAPSFEPAALELLRAKKNRILLRLKSTAMAPYQYRTVLNGVLWQERDRKSESAADLSIVTGVKPTEEQISDLLFANRVVKHSRSNTIVLAKNNQLLAAGVGQTSRVDALKQAIEKAAAFGFSLDGAVMASDAFFPFPDCVEIAHHAGISAVIQPGGSIKDKESVDYCDSVGMAMVTTGIRHFRH